MRYQWLKPVHPPVLVVKRYAWTGSRERHLKAAYVKMDPESGSSGRSGRSSPGDRRTEFDDVTWSGRSSHAFSSGSRRSGAKQEPSFDRYASSTQRTPAGHSSSFRESPSPEDQGSSDRQPSGASAGTAFGWFSRYLLQSTEDAGLIDSTQFDRARSDGIMTEDTTFTWLKTSPVIEGVTEYAGLSIRLPGAKEVQLWQTKVTATDDNVLPPRLAIVLLYKVDRNGQRDRFPTARITVRPGSELAKGIGRQTAQGTPQRAATPSTRSGTSRRTTSGGSRGFDADFSFGDTLPRARTWADEESSRDQDRYGKSYHHESFNEWL